MMPQFPFRQKLWDLLGHQLATRLFGPGIYALIIKIMSAGLSYVMLVAFARMLNAKDYGHFGVLLNMGIVVSSIITCGLPTGIMRFWSSHMANAEKHLAYGFHLGAQKFLLAACSIFIVLATIASWFGWGTEYLGFKNGVLYVAVLASVTAFTDYYANALRAQDRVLWSMVPRDVLWRILSPLIAACVLYATGALNVTRAATSCIIILLIVAIAQAIASRHTALAMVGKARPKTDWSTWRKPLLSFAGASVLYAMVQQLDVVVIAAYLGAEQAGAYFAAQKSASLLGLVMIAGGLVAAPLMSTAYHSGRKQELQRLCKMLALAIAVTTVLGFVVIALIGKSLLTIFDPAYQSAYPLLLILALGYAIDALAGPTAYLMQMTSLESAYLRIMAVVYACVLTLQIVFVPIYGAIAAASATALGVALWNIIAIYQMRRSIGVDSSILSFFLPPRQT